MWWGRIENAAVRNKRRCDDGVFLCLCRAAFVLNVHLCRGIIKNGISIDMKDDTCMLRPARTKTINFFFFLSRNEHDSFVVEFRIFDIFIAAGNVPKNIYHFQIEWPVPGNLPMINIRFPLQLIKYVKDDSMSFVSSLLTQLNSKCWKIDDRKYFLREIVHKNHFDFCRKRFQIHAWQYETYLSAK